MTNDSQSFRAAMAQLGSAVCILSTGGPAGRYGITASAVTAVSDDPPSLIVCVNVLSCDQETVSAAFSNPSVVPARRFDTGEWQDSPIGNPVLAETAAYFDCEVDKAVEYGTHTVFFCKALDISVSQATTCLIYQGRAYHKIEGFG